VTKPIAVLTHNLADGIQYILAKYNGEVAEYSVHQRRIVANSGQEYFVITDEHQLRGLEISDFIITPGFGRGSEAQRMVLEAIMRIREEWPNTSM